MSVSERSEPALQIFRRPVHQFSLLASQFFFSSVIRQHVLYTFMNATNSFTYVEVHQLCADCALLIRNYNGVYTQAIR